MRQADHRFRAIHDRQIKWKEGAHLRHRTKWRARTFAGKHAVARSDAARARSLAKKLAAKPSGARRGGTAKGN